MMHSILYIIKYTPCWVSDMYTSWKHHQSPDNVPIHHSHKCLQPLLPFPDHPKTTMVTLHFLEIYKNQIIPCELIWVWFLTTEVIIWGFILKTVYVNDPFSFTALLLYSIVWISHTSLSSDLVQLLCYYCACLCVDACFHFSWVKTWRELRLYVEFFFFKKQPNCFCR